MKRALLINDSKFESLILKDMLGHLDYEVELADEYDALYQFEQFEPDLVVANYIMHETRGDELIKQIKEERPNVKCLISSNSPLKKDDFKSIGLDGILRTPVSMFTLTDLLRRVEASKTIQFKKSIMTETLGVEDRICYHCNADISAFSLNIVFCPFCGEEIE